MYATKLHKFPTPSQLYVVFKQIFISANLSKWILIFMVFGTKLC